MCGIVSYYGKKDSVPFLINGLRRLEYRGYDSAGIALMKDGIITSIKKAGKIDELDKKIKESPVNGSIGIAHHE
jgi:glucosamine--fructose-6-phosphate aminotransferase (isomerizing)